MIYIHHSPNPPPSPFIKGGQNFSKMALMGENGGESEFLLEMGRARNSVLTPSYFMKTPPSPPKKQMPTPPTFKFCPTPDPHLPVTSNPHTYGSICCPVSLAEWGIMPHLMCYFT